MPSIWKPPSPGDIVWCWFPERPAAAPGPKPRPALVAAVVSQEDGVVVHVVYGTSQRVDHLKAGEFAITRAANPSAFTLAGLAFDTKFDFKVALALPWTDQFFKVAPRAPYGQTPKLGILHPSLMRAAKAAHDAAASR
ncbi:MAG: hypothetical protein JHC40_20070 [Burkholderiales bacterium]|jgi:hypothetical protein|nr:hypothetical protein [Burkholderiales bacterium]